MKYLSLFATILALCVVLLGGFTRLKNAGLGCPDWPGCYGYVTVPTVEKAMETHPDSPLVSHKAWIEMTHRYFAGTLAVLILALFVLCLRSKKLEFIKSASLLLGLVVFQAILGMWTVTLKLHPFVVMSHLLGGLGTFSVLVGVSCRMWGVGERGISEGEILEGQTHRSAPTMRKYLGLGLILLVVQIALGGWTSANYASLACPDFPTCQNHLIPHLDFSSAFHVWRDWGENHEGGLLHNQARMTIHWVHRVFAFVVFFYFVFLSVSLIKKVPRLKKAAFVLLILAHLQVFLGISNVIFGLPLLIAVSHLCGASLLLATLIYLLSRFSNKPRFR